MSSGPFDPAGARRRDIPTSPGHAPTVSVFPLEEATSVGGDILLDPESTLAPAPGGIAPAEPAHGGDPRREALLVGLLALLVYLIPWHGSGLVPATYTSRDTLGNRLIAASLASRHSLDITPWFDAPPSATLREHVVAARTVATPAGAVTRYVPKYPVGTGLMAAPFFVGVPPRALEHRLVGNPWRSLLVREHLAAAVLTALAVALFHLLLRGVAFGGLPFVPALVLTLALAFGSPAWSANSQALWSHTGSMLVVVVLLHVLARTAVGATLDPSRRLLLAGLLVGVAVACRPSHLVWIGVVPVAVVVVARRFGHFAPTEVLNRLAAFVLGVAIALGALAALHQHLHGDPFGPYLRGLAGLGGGTIEVEERAAPSEALAGLLVSPGVGLLVFCPILLLGLLGLRASWQEGIDEIAALLAFGGLAAMTLLNPYWWGGWSWGPRLFADAMPLALLMAAPAVRRIAAARGGPLVLALLVGWSALLHGLGVARFDYGWFFERPGLAVDRAPLWLVRDGLVADAWRAGLPQGPPPPDATPWRRSPVTPPDWLARGLDLATPLTAAWLDVAALRPDAAAPWSGLAPAGDFPHRLLAPARFAGAYVYRDHMTLAIPAFPRRTGARAWLATAFPAEVRGRDDGDDRGGLSLTVAPADAPGALSEPIAVSVRELEAGGSRWRFAAWPLPAAGAGGEGAGSIVTLHRPRPPLWGDPLATVPPVELALFPFVLIEE